MRTDPTPEIVEIIDDAGDTVGRHRVDPTRGIPVVNSRWLGVGFAVVLLVVAGYAIVSSSIESKPSTSTSPGLISPQYYVADPQAGFGMYMAEARGESDVDPADFAAAGQAEVWATLDATATTGAWFVVSEGQQHATGRNSYRTIVDDVEVIFEHDPASGQTRLSFTKDGHDMAITSFGWIDRQLVRLVRSVNLDESTIRFSDGFFTSDHHRVLVADPMSAMFGLPVSRVGYTKSLPIELAQHFTITVAGDNVIDGPEVAKFALTDTTAFTVGHLPAIVGKSAADPTTSIAQWKDGDRLITVEGGNLGAQQIIAIARSVRESSPADVHQQLTEQPPVPVEHQPDSAKTLASGMLADGVPWTIRVDNQTGDNAAGYIWWIGQPGGGLEPRLTKTDSAPTIDTFVEHGRTYILASIPRSMDGAELHVAPTGLPSLVTRLRPIDSTLPGEFAASVFLQPVPFTARIIDANGATVAFWPIYGRS